MAVFFTCPAPPGVAIRAEHTLVRRPTVTS